MTIKKIGWRDIQQWLPRLLDVLFLLAICLSSGWIMFLAVAGIVVSIALRLRKDWKAHHKFDLVTIIFSCVALALTALLVYATIAPIIVR